MWGILSFQNCAFSDLTLDLHKNQFESEPSERIFRKFRAPTREMTVNIQDSKVYRAQVRFQGVARQVKVSGGSMRLLDIEAGNKKSVCDEDYTVSWVTLYHVANTKEVKAEMFFSRSFLMLQILNVTMDQSKMSVINPRGFFVLNIENSSFSTSMHSGIECNKASFVVIRNSALTLQNFMTSKPHALRVKGQESIYEHRDWFKGLFCHMVQCVEAFHTFVELTNIEFVGSGTDEGATVDVSSVGELVLNNCLFTTLDGKNKTAGAFLLVENTAKQLK